MDGMPISEYARLSGLSPKTIRRKIKTGAIQAVKVAGVYGQEYRITEPPPDPRPVDNRGGQAMDMIDKLNQQNIALAGQLGAAQEKIKTLENQVLLLTESKRAWWRRFIPGIPG